MRVAIFGLGAMGCLFGARLSLRADVTLIGRWPEQLDALHRAPLRIINPDGSEEHVAITATDDLSAVGAADVALILTKSVGTERAAQGAARVLKPGGVAITLQNGLGNLETLARHVGAGRATLGVTAQGAATDGPGVLHYGGAGSTHLATQPEIDGPVRAVAAMFTKAGLPTGVADDVSALVWGKLAVNCAINPLTALLGVPNGALAESGWARGLMGEAAREVAAVAAAQGIALPFEDATARAEEVARLTAHNRSSMLQDVRRGVETEIEAICGAVVRHGEALDVPTPTNRTLYRLVKGIEEVYGAQVFR
jgi:2-dehydropantoate 2-reductase